MTRERLQQILQSFESKRILVIGDLMLDEFIWGNVKRISPEAPVPIVEVERESYFPGGAANVARNLREFARDVRVMAIIGTDAQGTKLKQLLNEHDIRLDCIQEDANYRTIVKTRIIARHQQVVRVDREQKTALTESQTKWALHNLHMAMPALDAIILEDYGKGLLNQAFLDEVLAAARSAGKIVTVDPNPNHRLAWRAVTAVTPNRSEAFAAAGQPWSDPAHPAENDIALIEVGRILLQKWNAENLLITLGEQGMMLFRQDAPPFHLPTRARDVFDVSGAGDTAIALFTLALCSGATPVEAADISNHASGVVVGKLGTATLTPAELLASFENFANV